MEGGGAVLFGVIFAGLFALIVFGLDLVFAMIGYGLLIALIGGSILCFSYSISYIIDLFKNKHYIKALILIGLLAVVIILNKPYEGKLSIFANEYTFLSKKILGVGIISLGIVLLENYTQDIKRTQKLIEVLCTITLIAIIGCSGFLIYKGKFNSTIFVSENPRVENFWEDQKTKKEAKKLNLRSELELILDEYKNGRNVFTNGNPIEFSVEGINNIITRFGYREYNGIRCYALEDKGDKWLVGMNYGEVLGLFANNKNLGDTGNYFVDKNTYEITGVHSETKPQS